MNNPKKQSFHKDLDSIVPNAQRPRTPIESKRLSLDSRLSPAQLATIAILQTNLDLDTPGTFQQPPVHPRMGWITKT